MRNSLNRFRIEPLSPAIGAEISCVDLSQPLDGDLVERIRGALLEHLVVFFRDQRLTEAQHKRFGRCFGPLEVDLFVKGIAEHPEILEIVKEADDDRNFAGEWHTDVSFLERPALGSILYAREVPDCGGDTLFANMYLAYESLSDGMRALLDGLHAVHCAHPSYDRGRMDKVNARAGGMKYTGHDPRSEWSVHPVVRTHPETGRKVLYVNSSYTVRFDGMTEAESRPLLEFLLAHLGRPELTCRFRWRAGSLAFWDNRCSQHFPINDYRNARRAMHRITIAGERP